MDHPFRTRDGLAALALIALIATGVRAEPVDRFDGSWAGRVRQSSGMQQCMPRIKFRIAVSDGRVTGEADATGRHLEFTGTIDENGALAGTVTGWETIAVSGRYRDGEIRGTWTHRVCGWKFTLIRDAS